MRAFEQTHADVFFGRTAAIEAVLNAVRRQQEVRSGFVLVLGASGSGKSSLIAAGVLPLLTSSGVMEGVGLWRKSIFRPGYEGDELLANLARALLNENALPELADPETMDPATELLECLQKDPGTVAERVRFVLNEAARHHRDKQCQQMRDKADALRRENRIDDASAMAERRCPSGKRA